MMRFGWWLFWFLAYCYFVSTGGFDGWPAKDVLVTACGVAVLTWPLLLPLVQGYRGPRVKP
jgi:hypothetical protein